jgi:hypothetical protein
MDEIPQLLIMSCCYKKEIHVPPVKTKEILEYFLNVSLGVNSYFREKGH